MSSYHIRRLCESGIVDAELSAGQQWQIPLSEVDRLQRDGVPPVPTITREEEDEREPERQQPEVDDSEDGSPSGRVIEAAEDVKVAASRLQKRRLERESEEVEDWFREREQRQSAERASERQRAEAAQREQRRQQWMQEWTAYALDSLLPRDAPREVELDVHACVQQALSGLDAYGPAAITKRIVTAAVEKALRP